MRNNDTFKSYKFVPYRERRLLCISVAQRGASVRKPRQKEENVTAIRKRREAQTGSADNYNTVHRISTPLRAHRDRDCSERSVLPTTLQTIKESLEEARSTRIFGGQYTGSDLLLYCFGETLAIRKCLVNLSLVKLRQNAEKKKTVLKTYELFTYRDTQYMTFSFYKISLKERVN